MIISCDLLTGPEFLLFHFKSIFHVHVHLISNGLYIDMKYIFSLVCLKARPAYPSLT